MKKLIGKSFCGEPKVEIDLYSTMTLMNSTRKMLDRFLTIVKEVGNYIAWAA